MSMETSDILLNNGNLSSSHIRYGTANQLEAIGTKLQRVANRGIEVPACGLPDLFDCPPRAINVSKSGLVVRLPKPLPLGYLLHYPINILIHIFWLASRRDTPTLLVLSRVSKFFHEVCKPLAPSLFTLARTTYITDLMELGHGSARAQVELYRQLVRIPDMERIQNLRDEYPSKITIQAEQFLYGRPYSGPQFDSEKEMCNRETQIEPGDCEVPSWAPLASSPFIRRPQPAPQEYLLNYPTDLLTYIFGLACIDDLAAGRSLCLVSKGFQMAVKPVLFYWIQLKRPTQVFWLAHLISVDVAARVGIRRLTVDTCGLEKALLHEEPDWDERDSIGKFHWDSDYWGDADAGYTYESSDESSDSSDSGEEMDIEQDVAFVSSPEGWSGRNLIYGADRELAEGARWPLDVGLEKASAIINNTISNILHSIAPVLWNLGLTSMGPGSVTLPIFPELSELTIHITLLHFLQVRPYVLFPALKYLHIRGRLNKNHIDLDDLIHHASSITEIYVPFDRSFLRALIGRVAVPSPHDAALTGGEECRFGCVEKIYVGHDARDRIYRVFGQNEPLFAAWDSLVHLRPYAAGEE